MAKLADAADLKSAGPSNGCEGSSPSPRTIPRPRYRSRPGVRWRQEGSDAYSAGMRAHLLLSLLLLSCSSHPYPAPESERIQVGRISVVPPGKGWFVAAKEEAVLALGKKLAQDHNLSIIAANTPFPFANLEAMASHLRNNPPVAEGNIQRPRVVTELLRDTIPPCVEVRIQLEETSGKVTMAYSGIVRWYLPVDGGNACTLTFSERRALTIAPADITAESRALLASCRLHP